METKSLNTSLEIWGGIECTINRIEDCYLDQLHYSKHYDREEDIPLIAGLGIKKLRYPILWEYHQPHVNSDINWSWVTKQLDAIKSFGITPIAGLVHHGSGPEFTNLLDQNFPNLLAAYAKKVAAQFPWIEFYTPVNEPLTTARFSGLYGFWYPHHKNDISFARMILHQVKGIILSMKAIREINPLAKLVQTEDLGKTYSTPFLEHQARFENERRWLTTDLLCGTMTPGTPMWKYFSRLGIPEEQLVFFMENPCPPDIMGFNHYLTSERFLDEQIQKYPSYTHGGNELQEYADVEAIRVSHINRSGLKVLLKEANERYNLPMAISEVQLDCTRDEQLRWLKEVYDTCAELKGENIPVVAVTAWALFGAFGWNRLLTSAKMDYEPGSFDVRSGNPRPTALCGLIKNLASGEPYAHPVTGNPGWWHRISPNASHPDDIQPFLIIGKTGTLGKAFAKISDARALSYILLGRNELDITNEQQVENALLKFKPWAVINAAGYVKVDEAETEMESCFSSNMTGACVLAMACQKYGIQYMSFSSDFVFDGEKGKPYFEEDTVNPLNIYGNSKALAEVAVTHAHPGALVIRTSSFFGPWDEYNFIKNVTDSLSSNKIFTVAGDVFISPTYVPDLVNVSLDLLIDKEKGIWHLTNNDEISWARLAEFVALRSGLDRSLLQIQPAEEMGWKATRPKYSVLKSRHGVLMPSLKNAMNRYFEEVKVFNEHPLSSEHFLQVNA
ncbi:MAG: family 1 glycosylhydrolase [Ginsengibacter sp.]